MQCTICEKEISSKYFYQHCQANHNIRKPSINQHVMRVNPKPDSIYRNYGKLKPGVVMVMESGDYLTLDKPMSKGWNTTNIYTRERRTLDLIEDMVEMRYVGILRSQTKEGLNVTNHDDQSILVEEGAYKKRIFLTAQINYQR